MAERLVRGFWPVWSILIALIAALMLGWHDSLPLEVVWIGGALALMGLAAGLWVGIRGFRWPGRGEALARLDATLPGQPIQALMDDQAIGGSDAASQLVWEAHQARMAQRAAQARAARPDLRVARRDPFALRYVALLLLSVGLIFGSVWRVSSVRDLAPGSAQALASGPAWEGWVEPPAYTRLPALYLADIDGETLEVPEGSRITLRLYGEVGALSVTESVSGEAPVETEATEGEETNAAASPSQAFTVAQDGRLEIEGPGGRAWDVAMRPDSAPQVAVEGEAEVGARGEMTLPFRASDDHGVRSGTARITLDMETVDRRHGLAIEPEPREAIEVPLPMPVSGDRAEFSETLIEDFSQHPWANLPVRIELSVSDDAGQTGTAETLQTRLPARRFFDPLASAVAEQRRDLLWSRENAPRIAQVLRAVSHRPDDVFRSETSYLRLRVILRRMERYAEFDALTDAHVEEMSQALWDLAVLLEEGDLGDALERLRRAQDRLAEAMRNGASDEEIAELMQELREATQDYMRQLAEQQGQQGEGQQQAQNNENSMQMTQDDLQRMMDRIQELMEQGRMAEAQQALEELQRMMENMRVTQGQQGQGQQSPGQQAMEGLSETLRDQQGLSDEAFRDLQDQFNQGENQGQQPGQQQPGQQGQQPGQGQGQRHGQGQQPGQQPGDGSRQPGEGQGQQQADDLEGSLADRQQALRDELNRQRQNLPGGGTEQGDAARDSLGRAEDSMDDAEEALRGGDLPEAIDRQADAMDALRDGIRNLGEAMAEQQRNQGQQDGEGQGGNQSAERRDPLGRNSGSEGQLGSEEQMLQDEDVYRRSRELLDELRRRSGEGQRPEVELEYLERLLERF